MEVVLEAKSISIKRQSPGAIHNIYTKQNIRIKTKEQK